MTVALTIAGSDPSGGAGIQADLRTFAALSVVGVSAITALTVQNSLGVQSVHPVPADVLAAQLEAIFSDTKVNAVKIGMLGGAEQVRAVAAALQEYSPPNIVLDPVLASTGGVPLLDEEGRHALLAELMPLCDLLTPNVPELGELTGMATDLGGNRALAVQHLQSLGAKGVLVKGGHLPNSVADRLYQSGASRVFTGQRIDTAHTHGTGCLLASAIAAHLALNYALENAIASAKEVVTRSLYYPVVIAQGTGYPDVLRGARRPADPQRPHGLLLNAISGIYVVTDSKIGSASAATEITEDAYLAGRKRCATAGEGNANSRLSGSRQRNTAFHL